MIAPITPASSLNSTAISGCEQGLVVHLDLFSGIGGFALAAQMVGGIKTAAFCEIDPWARQVLSKNFPGVPIRGNDIATVAALMGHETIETTRIYSHADAALGVSPMDAAVVRPAKLALPAFA